jgi:hypothetical protein
MGWRGGKRGLVLNWRRSGAGWFCSGVGVSTVCTGVGGMVEKQGPICREQGPGTREQKKVERGEVFGCSIGLSSGGVWRFESNLLII